MFLIEKHDDLKLPMRINVELVPRDMSTWIRVQEMSQNPRVKTAVPLLKRLTALIEFVNLRWRTLQASAVSFLLIFIY